VVLLGIVGSPRNTGLTSQIVKLVLKGASKINVETEIIYSSEYSIEPCHDIYPSHGEKKNLTNEDTFHIISDKIEKSEGIILGSPVYWSDVSCWVKNLAWRLLRSQSRPKLGTLAVGISVAGGSGNGLISTLRPMYLLFRILGAYPLNPIPVTRFNFKPACGKAFKTGVKMAEMIEKAGSPTEVERHKAFLDLPYINFDFVEERLLLVQLLVEGIIRERKTNASTKDVRRAFLKAKDLVEKGDKIAAIPRINEAYQAGISVWQSAE
jgi:multimeric flavodoxin WrbA